jgi:hypothetical protein
MNVRQGGENIIEAMLLRVQGDWRLGVTDRETKTICLEVCPAVTQ